MDSVSKYIASNWEKTVRKSGQDASGVPLPRRFTVPTIGPTFRAFFYWDTYFTCLGLIRQGHLDLALDNAGNFIYLCKKLGYIPNFNIRGHLNRSQLPVAAMLYREIFAVTQDREWLAEAYDALKIEYSYWMSMRMGPDGLNRHGTHATPSEIDDFYGVIHERLSDIPEEPVERRRYLLNSIAEAENWDFTPRYDRRCTEFYAVDLNALIYAMETIARDFASELGKEDEVALWENRAGRRRELSNQFLWSKERGLYFDYDHVRRESAPWITAANYFAMAAGLPDEAQAEQMREACKPLEVENGIATIARHGREQFHYQWDYPNAWPPIQALAMMGCARYGYSEDAARIARNYRSVVERNFEETGQLWEKYNAVSGGVDVVDEYEMPPMMGWTAGVYLYAQDF